MCVCVCVSVFVCSQLCLSTECSLTNLFRKFDTEQTWSMLRVTKRQTADGSRQTGAGRQEQADGRTTHKSRQITCPGVGSFDAKIRRMPPSCCCSVALALAALQLVRPLAMLEQTSHACQPPVIPARSWQQDAVPALASHAARFSV